MQMKKKTVEFKGTKDGVIIYCLDGWDFSQILTDLSELLQQRAAFFADAQVRVDVGERTLTAAEKGKLAATISEYSSMKLTGILTAGERPFSVYPVRRHEEKKNMGREDRCLVIKRTLRSGQSVRFAGSVVVLGDINPGAEIVAEGDIFVFGTVRGIVHAGVSGDREASVVALRLVPAQLRIADMFSRSPDGELPEPDQAEYAHISEDGIMITSISIKTGL
jgi:septum site-determining protein MinC